MIVSPWASSTSWSPNRSQTRAQLAPGVEGRLESLDTMLALYRTISGSRPSTRFNKNRSAGPFNLPFICST